MLLGGFQNRVGAWILECFGEAVARDRADRAHRFLEEAIELVQTLGCTPAEAHELVDYVFGRPVGEAAQECGGVMVTLAALCLASGLEMNDCAEAELARIWGRIPELRAKRETKPAGSPLPAAPVTECATCGDRGKVRQCDGHGWWMESCPDCAATK